MNLSDGQIGAAVAVTTFGVWSLHSAYTHTAPSLASLRCDDGSTEKRQLLLDADICVGGLAVLGGVAVSWLTRSWLPIILTTLGFALLSGYHHLALKEPTPEQIDNLPSYVRKIS